MISLGQTPMVMIMAPSKGHKTVQDFVKAAKAKPDSINFASAGVGTATHLAAERFIHSAGIKAVHIPHRGGAEALTDVIAGRVDFYFCPIGTAIPHIRAGPRAGAGGKQPEARRGTAGCAIDHRGRICEFRLLVLGRRVRPGQDAEPASSRACIRKLRKAMQIAAVKTRLAELGVEAMDMSAAEFDALVQKEIVTSAALAKAAGLKPN